MKSARVFVLGIILLVGLASCRDVKEPVFEDVENVKLGKLELSSTTVTADVRFNNPNKFSLQLKSVECDLYVDSSLLGHFMNTEPVAIPARQSFRLPVKGDVQTLRLVEYSRRAILQEPSIVRVQGNARVGRMGLYRTIPFNYTDTLLLKF